MGHWQKGKGWGWVWGPDDEIGALNAITPQSVLAALKLVKQGKIADLGVTVDRGSFRWAGHAATEIMSYRTPHGERVAGDNVPGSNDPRWHSTAIFTGDNVGTHLDSLGHLTVGTGADTHWYNGYKEDQHGGDFGLRKASVDKFPPIVARGVLIDVAGCKNLESLQNSYPISPKDMREALDWERLSLQTGDVILIRTGAGRYWGETGADHAKLEGPDTAGITLESARWLVEEFGAILIGSDTSTVEVVPFTEMVHPYLLVEQGVPLGEIHYLEQLSQERIYEFLYVAATNKIKGAAAGVAMRPFAIY